ncbi:Amidase domain-containing protein [Mycena chlorophos]|uniref:Amidase domain-containing protein n=1 Tax=Mycena chlorophos TaxID=658473 RepID=A0A8H6SJJ5_MYCCL|nr:Amidase domain-containing protein [Mycena chlorophos]
MASAHHEACAAKRRQRQAQIDASNTLLSSLPVSISPARELKIHALPLSQIVAECSVGALSPKEVLAVYGKKTLEAQRRTNCVSDLLLDEALRDAEALDCDLETSDAGSSSAALREYPLLGVPVSIKDTVDVAGRASTIGLSSRASQLASTSAPIVRLLRDAGALVHAKTTVPACLFANETASDLFGRTTNPYSPSHGVGASSGGGGALLGCGGSVIEIATDMAGSARIPAHFCGLYGLKGSAGRFPNAQCGTSTPGLESVQIVAAPMARSLDDLEEFWKRVVGMRPWLYDFTCVPLPWRPVDLLLEGRKLKWGVIWDDGICPPTPACKRALSIVVQALKSQGHEVVAFTPPHVAELLTIGNELVFADGGDGIRNAGLPGEQLNRPLAQTLSVLALPRFVKQLLALATGTPALASLHRKSVAEERRLVVRRDELRADWHARWTTDNLDFVLSAPHPLPALANGDGDKASLLSVASTFLWNMLDYSAGIMPVTRVDRMVDSLPRTGKPVNSLWELYDAEGMHGLPVGVQVVGGRMQEEKVLEGMKVIVAAMQAVRTQSTAAGA